MAATATAPELHARHDEGEPIRQPLEALALPPAPEPRRRNTVMVGSLLAVAAGVMLVGGALAAYFDMRQIATEGGGSWLPEDLELPNVPLILAYGTLLMSSVTAQWAVTAIRIGARRHMYVAIGLTILFGISFINALSFSWSVMELAAGSSPFADAMYTVTIIHLGLVVAAILLFVVMGFRALGGQFTTANAEFVRAAAAFWHFAVAAGVVVWWCIWFLEGGP